MPFDGIVTSVKEYLTTLEQLQWVFAFGDEEASILQEQNVERFDPNKIYVSYPDELPKLAEFVLQDLDWRERELIEAAVYDRYSYKVLLFGAAVKLSRGEQLSSSLTSLLVEHLVSPREFSKRGKVVPPEQTSRSISL